MQLAIRQLVQIDFKLLDQAFVFALVPGRFCLRVNRLGELVKRYHLLVAPAVERSTEVGGLVFKFIIGTVSLDEAKTRTISFLPLFET